MKILLVFVLPLFLLSCAMPMSVNPLSNPDSATFDCRLKGLWKMCGGSDGCMYLHIGKEKKSDKTIMILVINDKITVESIQLVMFPTFIDGNSFMNVLFINNSKGADASPTTEPYSFVKYEIIDDNKLLISFINNSEILKAIKEGKLIGTADNYNDSAKITDTSENIVDFIRHSDIIKLFTPAETYFIKD